MWIVIMILKWIGILIGAILGLCLFLLALVLLVPVRYRVCVSKKEKTVYSFKVGWLLSVISVKKRINEDTARFFLFGIPIKGKKEKKKKKALHYGKEPELMMAEDRENESKKDGKREKHKKTADGEHVRKKKINRKKNFSFQKLSSIIKCMKRNRKALKRFIRELTALVTYLSPQTLRGKMVLGTGDPATTGLVFGGLSLFPAAYRKGVRLVPDFEEQRFEVDGYARGRLRMMYLLRLFLRLYRDREIMHIWKQINKSKKEAA